MAPARANSLDDALTDRLAWYDVARGIWWKQVTWQEIRLIQADRHARGVPLLKFYTERGRLIGEERGEDGAGTAPEAL